MKDSINPGVHSGAQSETKCQSHDKHEVADNYAF